MDLSMARHAKSDASFLERAADWFAGKSEALGGPTALGVAAGDWVALVVLAVGGWLVGWLLGWAGRAVLRRLRRRVPSVLWADDVEHRLTAPIGLLVAAIVVRAGIETLGIPAGIGGDVRVACNIAWIAAATLLAVRAVGVGKEYLQAVLAGWTKDAAKLRSITTRLTIPARILQFLIWIAGIAIILLQFRAVQEVGMSLLASAGLAGVILGLAAQRTVGNLLAGLQLAFGEPLRIGDTVVVEGEFGVVEEINLTHVVVRVWDLHRLILPVSYFVEKPFQNWTHRSSEVLGTIMVLTDFTVPVQEVRDELNRLLTESQLWDGKVGVLQVTELAGDRVELRALVSAVDSGKLWDLRCAVREGLLTWLQSRGQKHLPVQRFEAVGKDGASSPGPIDGEWHPAAPERDGGRPARQ